MARSTLVQDMGPLRSEIAGRLKTADAQITKLRKQAKEVEAAIKQAEADRKVLVQLAKVAGNGSRGGRGGARRGSGERAKQTLRLIGKDGGATKKDLVASLGVSEVRVQQLITELKKSGQISSAPQPGRRALVWSLTTAGRDAL